MSASTLFVRTATGKSPGAESLKIVLDGIAAAERAGLHPVKINMVPIRGVNDDEIEDFAKLTLKGPAHIRFIEFMPIGDTEFWSEGKYLSSEEIKRPRRAHGPANSGKGPKERSCALFQG